MLRTLANRAHRLNDHRLNGAAPSLSRAGALPALFVMTDARRLPDPVGAVARLPRGSGLILRHYDAPDRAALAHRLARLCRRRGIVFLVAGDSRLARRCGADGVHWPEWAVRPSRRPRPGWIVTAAAHSWPAVARAARAGVDAVLLSPVFPTASHPGAPALGPMRFAAWAARSPLPIYALGGVTVERLGQIKAAGAAGIAVVGAAAGTASGRKPSTSGGRSGKLGRLSNL